MKSWGAAVRDGAVASVLSTAILAAMGQHEAGSPFARTNATSHWIWGSRAATQDAPSWRHTAVGCLIHHASASFWAVIFAKGFNASGRREPALRCWPCTPASDWR